MDHATKDDGGALIGRTFNGRYHIRKLIGRGGMGSVFTAQQISMNKPVALKVLARHLSEDPRQVQRFNHEALASSRLRHPNTIRVFDYGKSEDGYLYLAMELLEGKELSKVVRSEGPLDPRRVVNIARQMVKSIGEAHELGLVHRDLKPDNIFLCSFYGEEDFVKVLDFGIAKFTEGMPEQASLTQTGIICGTPLYISPEQALGQEISARTDLYSLGVVLYELLTGKPPFRAETPIAIVMKHINETPKSITEMRGDDAVPPGLDRLVMNLLEKKAIARPASSREVGRILDELVASGAFNRTAAPAGGQTGYEATTLGTPAKDTGEFPAPFVFDDHGEPVAPSDAARTLALDPGPGGLAGAAALGSSTVPAGPDTSHIQAAAPMAPVQPARPWRAFVLAAILVLVSGGTVIWSLFLGGQESSIPSVAVSAPIARSAQPAQPIIPAAKEAVPSSVAAAAPGDEKDASPSAVSTNDAGDAGAVVDSKVEAVPQNPELTIAVTSTPAGAEIFEGTEKLGVTPLDVVLAAGAETRTLSARLKGAKDVELVLERATLGSEAPFEASVELKVEKKKKPTVRSAGTKKSSTKAAGTPTKKPTKKPPAAKKKPLNWDDDW